MRRLTISIALVALALGLVPAAHAGTTVQPTFSDTAHVTGLAQPVAIAFLPDGRMLIAEKGGALKLYNGTSTTTLITLSVCNASEMGLLGVAVDPSFSGSSGHIYLYRTRAGPGSCTDSNGRFNEVVRVTMTAGAVDPASLTTLLSGIRTDNGNHNAGTVRIGPDGKLWVSVGDAGIGDVNGPPGSSTNPYAQDLSALEGKVLRLELNGSPAAGNPFIGQPGARPEIYAYGFRNPFRMGFDPDTGRLWAGDVGQNNYEEIDIVNPGGNYAWPRCEGTQPVGCQQPGDVDPIFTYSIGSLGRSITGGAFAGHDFGLYTGQYFFGDYVSSKIWSASVNSTRDDISEPVEFVTGAQGPVDIVFGPDGALYYVALNVGQIRRVANISYVRPQGAIRFRVPLTIAYKSCAAPGNRTHGPGLTYPSCNPAVPESDFLTAGTNDANGRGPKFNGAVKFRVLPGSAAVPGDDADVLLELDATDIRRRSDLGDYTGEVQVHTQLRITDRSNGANFNEPATVQDIPFSFPAGCEPTTTDTTIGSTCSAETTADAVAPGAAVEGTRAIWEVGQVSVSDGGADGDVSTTPNTVFARQGIFIP